MKTPNKARNVARTLLKEAATRLRLTEAQLLELHDKNDRTTFSACLSYLEEDPNMFRRAMVLKNSKNAGATDDRYALVYDLISAFIVASPKTFWDKATESKIKLCSVCGKTGKETPSGWTCLDGHGGADVETVEAMDSFELLDETNVYDQLEDIFGLGAPKKIQIKEFGRPDIPWNDEQSKAFKSVFDWLKAPKSQQVYRLFGFAGCGKTTMLREISEVVRNGERGVTKGEVLFGAYTGKAAAIMISNGCLGASTLHSMIYRPKVDMLTGKIVGFVRNEESPLRFATLLICDEVSMVDDEMAEDLLSFGVKILVVGDPGQLKPIRGQGYFTRAEPDSMLTIVERVAAENPLIWMATRVRQNKILKPGRYGESRVWAPGKQVPDRIVAAADQIIVGTNRTRHALNKRWRMIDGKFEIDSQFPVKGERLMCLRNNKLNGLLNGTQWQCSEPELKNIRRLRDHKAPLKGSEPTNIEGLFFRVVSLDLYDADGNPLIINTSCSTHHFDENLLEPPWRDIAGTDEFTFAYAGTVHKLQGSQMPRVCGIDESHVFPDQRTNHLYTLLTRAQESVDLFLTE